MKQKIVLPILAAAITFAVFIACKKDVSDSGSTAASITALNCSSTTFSAAATINVVYNGTASVPYTGGNAVAYSAGTAIASTGVTGLTATLASGTLASGSGNLSYTITGTPATTGTAAFALTFGGQTCSMSLIVNAAGSTTPVVTALTCAGVTFSSSATVSVSYAGTAVVPYTGGNGITYTGGAAIASTGVTGLTATLAAGTLANGAGNIIYNITGTATTTGTAAFAITFGGQTCSLSLPVTTASSGCGSATGVAKVVCLANAFLATLTTTQQAQVVQTLNLTNAKLWSNLPCGLSCRDGIAFSSLTTTQLTAALAVIQAATSTTTDDGYDEFFKINETDSLLGTLAGSGYGKGQYIICFLGTPSTTGKWMLQFGGHHFAGNITYDAGNVVSITPSHQGVEPKSWTTSSGTVITPLANEEAAMANMLASFSSTELASAKISGTFSDVTMVPGSTTNTFPATKVGIKVSTLSTAAQTKVLAAMMPWVNDLDATSAAAFTAIYSNELANTYVSYASNTSGTSGNAATFFTTNTDYVRIDGPSVWIEFICQTGVVYPSQIHYHSVFRDHTRDYIGL